jgi:NAD(P)-dependent dehydrogenase (short-subunit alcohol dehydrogenase family)
MQHAPIALITGGSRGLGKAMALRLADRGTDVILTYRTAAEEAHAVVAAVEAKGRIAVALPLEVTTSTGFVAFADAVAHALEQRWDRPSFDFLVNNAGSGGYAPFAETTEAHFDEQLNVHLRSVFFLTQKLLPLIADGGRILNVSTGIARYTYAGFSSYAIMKGAVEVLTRYLAKELGPRRIAVNVIAPGGIDTDFGGGAMRDPAMHEMVAAQTALGRMGLPEDIGGVVAALLGPDTGWINGQRIEVTGGFSL